jgi:hypothetical protein
VSKGFPWAGAGGPAPVARDQYPPAAGSHAVSPDGVAMRTETIPESRSPGPRGHSNQTTGRAGTRGPKQSISNETLHESLRKPGLMR